MRKNRYQYLLFAFISVVLLSCDNSTTHLKDGYTLYGTIIDSNNGEKVDSVIISLGYKVSEDTISFNKLELISDTLGKFVFKGGIGTAPSDEILRFEHNKYFSKDIILSEEVVRQGDRYSILVTLQPK